MMIYFNVFAIISVKSVWCANPHIAAGVMKDALDIIRRKSVERSYFLKKVVFVLLCLGCTKKKNRQDKRQKNILLQSDYEYFLLYFLIHVREVNSLVSQQ